MKILITGAGGFLGKYLARALADHDVQAVTRQQLNLANAIEVANHFSAVEYDAVIHCGTAGRNSVMSTDQSILSNNLASLLNLMTHKNKFSQLINIGSGAEFDLAQSIDNISELEIFNCNPEQSYGLSKNIIARYLAKQPNCFTLRLFGCFDSSEDPQRLLPKFHRTASTGNKFQLQDRYFDTISAKDFSTIVRAVLNNTVTQPDINCVYTKKYRLSEILSIYCDKHGLDPSLIEITGQGLNYTGNGDTLSKYHLNLVGLEQSLANYETQSK